MKSKKKKNPTKNYSNFRVLYEHFYHDVKNSYTVLGKTLYSRYVDMCRNGLTQEQFLCIFYSRNSFRKYSLF